MANDASGAADRGPQPPPPGGGPQGADHRHPSGWRVQPSPEGRGMPPNQRPPLFRNFGWRFIGFLAVLLALNLWISTLIPSGHQRIRIPYSPTFLVEIKANNVKSISSKGSTLQGEFR